MTYSLTSAWGELERMVKEAEALRRRGLEPPVGSTFWKKFGRVLDRAEMVIRNTPLLIDTGTQEELDNLLTRAHDLFEYETVEVVEFAPVAAFSFALRGAASD